MQQSNSPLLEVQENHGHLFLPTNTQCTRQSNVVHYHSVYYDSSSCITHLRAFNPRRTEEAPCPGLTLQIDTSSSFDIGAPLVLLSISLERYLFSQLSKNSILPRFALKYVRAGFQKEKLGFRNRMNNDENVIRAYLWTRITTHTLISLRPQFTRDTLQEKSNTMLQRRQTQDRPDITAGCDTLILQKDSYDSQKVHGNLFLQHHLVLPEILP